MDVDSEDQVSHLFLVRLWVDSRTPGSGEKGHGKIQHVVTGKAVDFSSLPALGALLLEMVTRTDSQEEAKEHTEGGDSCGALL